MSRLERVVCWIPFVLLAVVVVLQIGMAEGRRLQSSEDTVAAMASAPCDFGEYVYLREPERILDAIRLTEGVPSYGIVYLARQYGGHRSVPETEGLSAAADLLHRSYRAWVDAGRPGRFLEWFAAIWAPVGARNDPANLNVHFLPNLLTLLGVRD